MIALADPCGYRREAFRRHGLQVEYVGVVVLDLAEAPALEVLAVVRRVVRALHGGRGVEAVDEHSLPLVRGVAVLARTSHALHLLAEEPVACRVQQCGGGLVVLLDLEEPEGADVRVGAVVFVETLVDGRRDPSDRPGASSREEVGHPRVAVVGVFGREQALDPEHLAAEEVRAKRRRPVRVSSVESPGKHRELADAWVS